MKNGTITYNFYLKKVHIFLNARGKRVKFVCGLCVSSILGRQLPREIHNLNGIFHLLPIRGC